MNDKEKIIAFLKEQTVTIPVDDFITTISNIYHKYEAKKYDERHFIIQLSIPYWNKVLNKLEKQFSTKEKIRVMDFGCGTGFATEQILSSTLKNKCNQIVCYDLSPDMVEECRKKFSNEKNISYLSNVEGFEQLKKETGKFDVIICNALIHHVLDHEGLFSVLANSVEEDGLIVIGHEPNKRFYENKTLKGISAIFRVYKRIKNKMVRLISSSKNNVEEDISTQTFNELVEKKIIQKSFPMYAIQKLVDIHVPLSTHKIQPWGELGFDKPFFETIANQHLQVIEQISYNHIKDQQAYKSFFWKGISNILEKVFPNDGADAIFILKRK